MKIFINLIVTLMIFFASACQSKTEAPLAENIEQQTPTVLLQKDEGLSASRIKTWSKRGYKSIIENLFGEALENNEDLRNYVDAVQQVQNTWGDSAKAIHSFMHTNSDYFRDANRLVNLLSDSILKKETKKYFTAVKNEYDKTVKQDSVLLQTINKKDVNLTDQNTLIKLFVTAKMIKQYQENEHPSKAPLHAVIKQYDSLITQANNFKK